MSSDRAASSGDSKGRILSTPSQDELPVSSGDMQTLLQLLPYCRPHARWFVLAIALLPVTAAASLVQPYLIKQTIDTAIGPRASSGLGPWIAAFALAIGVDFVSRFGQTYAMQLAGQRTMADLRMAVFRHLQRLSISYFNRTPAGRIVTRLTNDIDSLGELFVSGAVTAIADIFSIVAILSVMVWLDWQLSLIAFTVLPPLAILIETFRKHARAAFRRVRAAIAQLNTYLAEQVAGVTTVQLFQRERECAREYRDINDEHRMANYQAIRYDALLYSVVESASAACIALVLWYSATRMQYGGMFSWMSVTSLGTVVAFYEYIQRFFVPLRDLSTKYTVIQSSVASAERIFQTLQQRELDAPEGEVGSLPFTDAVRAATSNVVEFCSVTHEYAQGVRAIEDVSFAIRHGERVGVVGATGSGKSTLLSLLLRMYEPTRGVIRVQGRDVRKWDRNVLRRTFAVVPQQATLFAGSVLENIVLDDPHPDETRVWNILRYLGASDLVLQGVGGSDVGLHTRVTERGENFSAGQRQLFALARALYRQAPCLVLDEATSHVDSESEALVQQAFHRVLRDTKTAAIVVAHRLATVRDLDRILVMHRGRVVQFGTHDELVSEPGVYQTLCRLQSLSAEALGDEVVDGQFLANRSAVEV
jgi:ATP-binding cassette subfamily B multidrug efflux pump